MMETVSINPQIVTDGEGKKLGVFLITSEFEYLLEALEELEDIKAAEEAGKKA